MDEDQDEHDCDRVYSILDQDLYKFSMQCAVLSSFPDVKVIYTLINRTQHMRLTLEAFEWVKTQVAKLGNARVNEQELAWLHVACPFLNKDYLSFLEKFRFRPEHQIRLVFGTDGQKDGQKDGQTEGVLSLEVYGLWVETILYDILLLAIVSEAYFKFVDKDWTISGQEQSAKDKATRLLNAGCIFSELGTRRRRSYRTHLAVLKGLIAGSQSGDVQNDQTRGRFLGTSNLHLTMRFGLQPVGTVAHEWFMAIAALTDDYENANQHALEYWTGMVKSGVTPIAVTDTFGTPSFLEAFARPAQQDHHSLPENALKNLTYADIFAGVRQDSGDPLKYIQLVATFYRTHGITDHKIILFSDSLNVEKCITYRKATLAAGNLTPYFGIGTDLTNDFRRLGGAKSAPLNIVMKMTEANGRPVVKLSDHRGKHTGDKTLIEKVKRLVKYQDGDWEDGDESRRWTAS